MNRVVDDEPLLRRLACEPTKIIGQQQRFVNALPKRDTAVQVRYTQYCRRRCLPRLSLPTCSAISVYSIVPWALADQAAGIRQCVQDSRRQTPSFFQVRGPDSSVRRPICKFGGIFYFIGLLSQDYILICGPLIEIWVIL